MSKEHGEKIHFLSFNQWLDAHKKKKSNAIANFSLNVWLISPVNGILLAVQSVVNYSPGESKFSIKHF